MQLIFTPPFLRPMEAPEEKLTRPPMATMAGKTSSQLPWGGSKA
jgi:hypothetical protein